MKIIDSLVKIMDLPANWALKEAQAKLQDTDMLIDGKLYYIYEIGQDYIRAGDGEGNEPVFREVSSLEVWLPETGVYFHKYSGSPIFLQRKPLRQWKKSFSSDFYKISFPKGSFPFSVLEVDPTIRREFWVDAEGTIWHYESVVGYIKDSQSLVCTTKLYEQELRDWVNNT